MFGVIPESNGFGGNLGRSQETGEFRHQFVARSSTGEDRWLDVIVSPIKDKLNETVGFRGLAEMTEHSASPAVAAGSPSAAGRYREIESEEVEPKPR